MIVPISTMLNNTGNEASVPPAFSVCLPICIMSVNFTPSDKRDTSAKHD